MATASTEVGSLHLALGKVIARDPQGKERVLSAGDSVRLNEQVITGSDGVAHIDMIDGKVIVLYEGDGISLAEYLELNGFRFVGETGPEEISDILAALSGNDGGISESALSVDDLNNLEPPAAGQDGNGGQDEGVLLELNNQSTQAVADFDSFIPLEPLLNAPLPEENEDELPIADVEAIAPTGVVQNVTGDEDTAISLSLSAALVDSDGSEILTLSLSGVPEGSVLTDGSFTITADGSPIDVSEWDLSATTLTPPLNFNGSLTLSFTATATELNGGDQAASAQSFIVAVDPVNDAPIAEAIGPITTDEDSAILAIELLQTASDVDEDDLDVNSVAVNVASGVTPESDITFAINEESGQLLLDPAQFGYLADSESITLTFVYNVNDGTVDVANTATVVIEGRNDQPVVESVTVSELTEDNDLIASDGNENARFDGTLSVVDEDATDTHTFSLVAESVTSDDGETGVVDPENTSVSVNADGSYSVINPDFNALADGETVTVTFRYIATDDSGTDSAVSEEQTVTLTITGSNDQPVVQDVTLSALTEDSDLESDDGQEAAKFEGQLSVTDEDTTDTHTFSLVADSVSTDDGELGVIDPANTSVTVNADGSYSVVNHDFNSLDEGEQVTVSFSYIATDDSETDSADSEPKTVTLTITGSNDVPVAVEDTNLSTEENTALLVDVLANDTDEDTSDQPANFTLKSVALSQEGTGSVSIENNQLKFEPGKDFDYLASGESINVVVSYTMSDDSDAESSSTATITVTGTNDSPVAVADPDNSTSENASVTIDVLANDTDKDHNDSPENFSLDSVQVVDGNGDPLSGRGSASIVNNQLVFEPGTDFDYLAEGEMATVIVAYTMSDNEGAQSESTATIKITGTNDKPLAVDDTHSLSLEMDLIEPGSTNGSAIVFEVQVEKGAELSFDWLYTDIDPSQNFNDFSFVSINGNPQMLASVQNDQGQYSWTASEAGTYLITLGVMNDRDTLFDPSLNISNLQITSGSIVDSDTLGGYQETAEGFKLSPQNPSVDSSVIENFLQNKMIELQSVTGNVLDNDSDKDLTDELTVQSFDGESTPGVITGLYGDLTWQENGSYTYELDPDRLAFKELAEGERADEVFDYVVTDGRETDTASLTITVEGLNDPAVIEDIFNGFGGDVVEDGVPASTATGKLSATDVDNNHSDGFQAKSIASLYGTLVMQANGVWEYTLDNENPVINALNTDSPDLEDIITVESVDGTEAQITLSISGSNDAPTVSDSAIDLNNTDEDDSITISQSQLLAGSSDVDNDLEDLSAINLSVSSGSGSLTYDAESQSWSFKPSKDWSGEVTFNFDVSDGVDSTPSTAILTVDPVADKPVLNVTNVSGPEDTAVSLDIQALLSDQDGSETLSPVTISNIPPGWQFVNNLGELAVSGGVLVLNPGDEVGLKAIPPHNYSGTHTFTVSVTSSEQNSSSSETVQKPLEVEILPVAEPADLQVPEATSGHEDTAIDISGIQVSVGDTGDTNEQLTHLFVEGMPVGSVLSDGDQSLIITSMSQVDILSWNLAQLTIRPPENSDQDFELQVTAVTRDGDSEVTTDPQTIAVDVVPVLDKPSVDTLYTNNAEPTLTGEVALGENEILQVLVNGQLFTAGVGSAPLQVDAEGQWSLNMAGYPLPSDGEYEVVATVLNPELDPNFIQDSTRNELIFDTKAPKGTVVYNHKTNDPTPEISGKLKAPLGDDEYLKITVNGVTYVNREFPEQEEGVQLVDFIIGEDDRTWHFSLPEEDAINSSDEYGTEYSVEATVADRAGNVATPDDATLLVDVNPPAIVAESLSFSTGDSINSVESAKTFKISGMTEGAEQGQKVQVKLYQGDTEFNYEATVKADGSFVLTLYPQNPEHSSGRGIDLESFDDGSIEMDVSVTDKLGNLSDTVSDSTQLDRTLSGTEISVDAISNDSGVADDFRTNDFDGLTLTGSLNQSLAGDESLQISMDKGRTWLDGVMVDGESWSFAESEGTARTHGQKVNYWLRVVDEAGNTASQEEFAVQQVTFDNQASITSLGLNKSGEISWNEAGSLVKVNGRTQGVESGQSVSIKLSGLIAGELADFSFNSTVDNGRFTLELPSEFLRQFDDHSSVSIEAVTADLSANEAILSHVVELDFTVPGDTDGDHIPDNSGKPIVTLLGPDDGFINEDENSGGFKVLVSLPAGVEEGDRVRLTLKQVGGQSETIDYTVTAADLQGGQSTVLIPERLMGEGWLDGDYKVTARISDEAGNVSKKGPAYLFTLDTTPPVAEMFSLDQVNSDTFPALFTLTDLSYFVENDWPSLSPEDFQVDNGIINSIEDLGNGEYLFTITPDFDPGVDSGDISIQLAEGSVLDHAENGNEAFEHSIDYDNDDPVISLSRGLIGEAFNTDSSIANLDAAMALIADNDPDATFTATNIDYTDDSAPTLAEFLADGADGLTGDTTANVETMAFRFSGQIELGAGAHSFRITSDDGFILKINGEEVAKYEGLRSAAPTTGIYNVALEEGGYHSFELVYFENAVNASLKVEVDSGDGYQVLDQASTLKNSSTYTEGDGAIALDQGLILSDNDHFDLVGAEIKILNFQSGEDVLGFTAANGISVESYDSQTGTLKLTGFASIEDYEAALANVTYENTSEDPLAGQRLLSVKINDGQTWSAPVTTYLTVQAVNDAPEMSVSSSTMDYQENDGYQIIDSSTALSDVDNDSLHSVTIRISEGYVNGQDRLDLDNGAYDSSKITEHWSGQGYLTLTAKDPENNPVSVSEFESLLRQVKYRNSSDDPIEGTRKITWTANDGQDNSSPVESLINVIAVNDAAYVTHVRNWTYEENSSPVFVDNSITLVDPDSSHIHKVTLTISKNYDEDHDVLSVYSEQPGININWDNPTGTLTITAQNPAGLAKQDFEHVLETISFHSSGDNPSTAQRELTWVVDDGEGDGQPVVSKISIRAVNDAPENLFDNADLASQPPLLAEEDTVLQIDNLSVQDADANGDAIRVTLQVEHGQLTLGSSTGLSLSGQGTGSLVMQGSQQNINLALKTLSYKGLPDFNGNDSLVMTSNDLGNNGNGGAKESRSEIAIAVAPVNDKPLLASSSGLNVEVFDTSPASSGDFNSLSEVLTFMDDETADATFMAHILAFDDGNPDTLSNFIGNNGSDLSGLGSEPFETMALRFTGQIKLDAGTHNFTVRSDDGFSLKINGQVVTEFDRDRGPGNSSGSFSANSDGLYDIEIVYWENRGGAVLEVSKDGQILDSSLLFSNNSSEKSYQENQSEPVALFSDMALSDPDGSLNSLVIEVTGPFDPQSDQYLSQTPSGVVRQDSFENGVLTITFTGIASVADYQALLSSIRYENTSEDPVEGDRDIKVWVNDGELDSDILETTLTVTAVNDQPLAQGFLIEPASQSIDFSQFVSDPDHSDAQLQVIIEQLPEYGRLFLEHNGVEHDVSGSDLGNTRFNLDSLNYEVAELELGTALQPGIQGWGTANAGNSVLTSNQDGVVITTSTQDGEFEQYNQPGHVGVGLGLKNDGIKRSNSISVQYSTAIAFAVIGVDGLGGHFDANANQDAAVKISVTFEDGSQGVWTFDKGDLGISDSDYSADISVGHGNQYQINTEGLGILQMDFSASSNDGGSNWVLSSIESSVSDSFSYKAVDSDGATSAVKAVHIKGAAISGTDGDDVITGTTGNDVLIGHAGADTFQFTMDELLEEDSIQTDRILDFKVGDTASDTEADYLDLSDLLLADNTQDVSKFISDIAGEGLTVSIDQDNTIIEFNSTSDPDLQTLKIVLEGTGNDWGVNATGDEVLAELIGNGQLIV
ncbi:tandem-95 repeat protein [Endozoicomonas arenosclerae]|uniref:tandem-95 repeat protein n=1 Tax=Endozoicomonas arenosclerae TaxID=1633495 RepID=UPI0007813AEE|nr:Ig-like domain-containing protein [Endozoicomonas arenosclerae]